MYVHASKDNNAYIDIRLKHSICFLFMFLFYYFIFFFFFSFIVYVNTLGSFRSRLLSCYFKTTIIIKITEKTRNFTQLSTLSSPRYPP